MKAEQGAFWQCDACLWSLSALVFSGSCSTGITSANHFMSKYQSKGFWHLHLNAEAGLTYRR
jgi:hypothetical protein